MFHPMKGRRFLQAVVAAAVLISAACSTTDSSKDEDKGGATRPQVSPVKGVEKVGTSANFSTAARDVVVEGNYAYVATYTYGGNSGGVAVMDVFNKNSPVRVGAYFPSSSAYALYAGYITKSGDHVYIDGGNVRLFAKVSVLSPTSPSLVYQVSGGGVTILVADGNYLYLSNYGVNTLRIYDVSDNYAATQLASRSVPETPQGVIVDHPYVYVMRGDNKVLILNENAARTTLDSVGIYDLGVFCYVAKAGRYLYLCKSSPLSLEILDAINPAQPVKVSAVTLTNGGMMKIAQGCVFMASSSGIEYVDVADPANPRRIGFLADAMSMNGMDIGGDYVYVADGGGGAGKLRVYRMTK